MMAAAADMTGKPEAENPCCRAVWFFRFCVCVCVFEFSSGSIAIGVCLGTKMKNINGVVCSGRRNTRS